jgi:Predicted transcriptional regulator
MDQPKIERLLRLMKLLTANNKYTVEHLSKKLNMSVRTIYRYIDTFKSAGFVVKRDDNFIRLDKQSPHFKEISQLVHFTEEEAYILNSVIENIDENNVIKQNLKAKLCSVYNFKMLAECVVKGKNAKNVNAVVEAIENKEQIILRNYTSAHTKQVSDRLIEPFGFTPNYIQIWGYEPSSKSNKLFKTARIGGVEILKKDWEFEKEHKQGFMDIFRIATYNNPMPIKLKLGLRAASLLIEEYPLAEKELKEIKDEKNSTTHYILETNVSSYEGVGRFVLGLLDDIEVLETNDFKSFLKQRMNLAKF